MPERGNRAHTDSSPTPDSDIFGASCIATSLAEYESRAREHAMLADQVSQCIRKVEYRLNAITTKTATQVGEGYDSLSFERDGRGWRLRFGTCDENDQEVWCYAQEAPLEYKIRIVQLIPGLLGEMFARQRSTLEKLRACAPVVEQLAHLPDPGDETPKGAVQVGWSPSTEAGDETPF